MGEHIPLRSRLYLLAVGQFIVDTWWSRYKYIYTRQMRRICDLLEPGRQHMVNGWIMPFENMLPQTDPGCGKTYAHQG